MRQALAGLGWGAKMTGAGGRLQNRPPAGSGAERGRPQLCHRGAAATCTASWLSEEAVPVRSLPVTWVCLLWPPMSSGEHRQVNQAAS